MSDDLTAQVAKEAEELRNAATVISTAMLQRCHFCGQLTDGGTELRGPVPTDGGQQLIRFKGVCCGG